jgi:hypothetical protein
MARWKFKRVYRPVGEWEEIAHNMWGEATDRRTSLEQAISLTGDHKRYGEYMMRVVNEWPVSCENALTDNSLNQKAWVGHAAVALAINCPEDITRIAWGYLTDEQRLLANKAAERAIHVWAVRYAKSRGVLQDMGGSLLS